MRRQYCSRIFFYGIPIFFLRHEVDDGYIFFSIDDLVPKWKILRIKTN